MRSNLMTNNYPQLIQAVRKNCVVVGSRFGDTTEQVGLTVHVEAGRLVHRARINYAIGWMELLQLVAGEYDPEALKRAAPNARHELFTKMMSYGPRLILGPGEQPLASSEDLKLRAWLYQPAIDQVARCTHVLAEDRNSRQAIVSIARPWETGTNDLPCTLTIQYLWRGGVVHSVVSMRSWDLLKGLPYDIMMFGGLQQIVAHLLHAQTGDLIITAGSAHVYEDEADGMVPTIKVGSFYMPRFTSWKEYRAWAAGEVHGKWLEQKGGIPAGIKVIDVNRMTKRHD